MFSTHQYAASAPIHHWLPSGWVSLSKWSQKGCQHGLSNQSPLPIPRHTVFHCTWSTKMAPLCPPHPTFKTLPTFPHLNILSYGQAWSQRASKVVMHGVTRITLWIGKMHNQLKWKKWWHNNNQYVHFDFLQSHSWSSFRIDGKRRPSKH